MNASAVNHASPNVHADILGTSIERDSVKDEAVVFIFILATAGLLVWALAKPYVQKWLAVCICPIRVTRRGSCQLNV